MITHIKNANIYSPKKLENKEIIVAEGKIIAIGDNFNLASVDHTVFDVNNKLLSPGFIDQHVHITGGGGQNGYASFIPQVQVEDLVKVGTTTVLGMLGTDGYVKGLGELYSKAKALDAEGLTSYMLTGFYGLPTPTITDSVASDLIFVDKVIGCKIAISDDRCSFPTKQDLLRVINQVKLGGFTSGKIGLLHIHLGNLESKIDVLLEISKEYPTLIQYISPTHCIRTKELFESCVEFAKLGGMMDISTGGTKFTQPHQTVAMALEMGAPLSNLTFSSDGRGGVKRIDPVTNISTYTPAPLNLNYKEMVLLVKENILPLEDALKLITTNPAKNMKIKGKAHIAVGYDADFVVLNEDLSINDVVAKGKMMIESGEYVHRPIISL